MRAIVDTNVVLSGLFFGGVPGRVLAAWRDGHFELVLSASILAEYREAGAAFEANYGRSDFEAFASLILVHAHFIDAPDQFPEQVCKDADDDKFLACSLAAGVRVIVSGDKKLRALTGWNGIDIVTPRQFLDTYLPNSA